MTLSSEAWYTANVGRWQGLRALIAAYLGEN